MPLAPEELLKLKECFALFDKDADGLIVGHDMGVILRAYGVNVTDEEIHKKLGDKVGAQMNFKTFTTQAEDMVKGSNPHKDLVKAFKLFDRDNNGTISAGELKHVLLNLSDKLTPDDVEKLIKQGDKNGNGSIEYSEFATLLLGS